MWIYENVRNENCVVIAVEKDLSIVVSIKALFTLHMSV